MSGEMAELRQRLSDHEIYVRSLIARANFNSEDSVKVLAGDLDRELSIHRGLLKEYAQAEKAREAEKV